MKEIRFTNDNTILNYFIRMYLFQLYFFSFKAEFIFSYLLIKFINKAYRIT